jgi:hypothetical protein
MNATDYVFLAVCVLALAVLVGTSKVLRAILWETLRHPFRPSRIEFQDGQIVVSHPQSIPTGPSQGKSAAGAR